MLIYLLIFIYSSCCLFIRQRFEPVIFVIVYWTISSLVVSFTQKSLNLKKKINFTIKMIDIIFTTLSICALFIYLGFYIAFNTVQVTYSSSEFCTVNCRPTASNYQLSHLRPCREPRPQRWEGRVLPHYHMCFDGQKKVTMSYIFHYDLLNYCLHLQCMSVFHNKYKHKLNIKCVRI